MAMDISRWRPISQWRPLRWLPPMAIRVSLVGAIALTSCSLALTPMAAQTQLNHPFAGHGVVYVLMGDRWREANIIGISGFRQRDATVWRYVVEFLDAAGGSAVDIPPSRMRTIAAAQTAGLTSYAYDLSTQAGIDQMLDAHNEVRRAIGVPDLVWSADLATLAQDWAHQLVAEQQGLHHRPAAERNQGHIGENLASRASALPGGAMSHPHRAVQGWVAEQDFYNYDRNICVPGQMCGHYTQMVWATTTEVGCGVARNADATYEVWACNYAPAGNIVGQRPY